MGRSVRREGQANPTLNCWLRQRRIFFTTMVTGDLLGRSYFAENDANRIQCCYVS